MGCAELPEHQLRPDVADVTPLGGGRNRGLMSLLERLGLVPSPPQGAAFHGFISYSHAADERLAVALQRGLHLGGRHLGQERIVLGVRPSRSQLAGCAGRTWSV
jgi:hypothetical protein